MKVVETSMADQEYRIEHDTMGEVRVPAAALWGAQTQRAVENFPISGRPIERELIGALADYAPPPRPQPAEPAPMMM